MIKVLQYGEGNFLRSFADLYFQTLNNVGCGEYEVNIVKPAPFGTIEKFVRQKNEYNVVLRGYKNGSEIEEVCPVSCINRVIDPFFNHDEYISLALDPDLKLIVSNTTEAGICFNEKDDILDFKNVTFPAKLTKFLYERFKAGLGGVYLLPVELIDDNADNLKRCVDGYISLWNLPKEFKLWNDTQNFYCNTLVDRIVSGYPKDEKTLNHLFSIIGKNDELVSVGEPFGLWAIENKGEISKYVKQGAYNIEVVLTENIGYYKKRKVRVLNGSHTNLVPIGLMMGEQTVYDCMKNERLKNFVGNTLEDEIIPFVSSDIGATVEFANSVIDRFLNPFLNHQLVSISLNSISKWRARNLPSFSDYYKKYCKLPPNMTIGFSYLIALYSSVKKIDGRYIVKLKNGEIELKDDVKYLDYFADNRPISGFLADIAVWGEDLTAYDGFLKTIEDNVEKIKRGIDLI